MVERDAMADRRSELTSPGVSADSIRPESEPQATSNCCNNQAKMKSTIDHIARGDEQRKAKKFAEAIDSYGQAAQAHELPPPDLCLKLARCHWQLGDGPTAVGWLQRVVDGGEDFTSWQAAAGLLGQIAGQYKPATKRTAKLAILGSYTTTQLVPLLKLTAMREGIALETYEASYGQYRQDMLDPGSAMWRFSPEFIMLAVHEGELAFPQISGDAQHDLAVESARWTSLWQAVASRSKARVIQHNFAVPPLEPMGHLGARLASSRQAMAQALNARLGEAAGTAVSIVDCERLASTMGKDRWFDDKYWFMSKQAVSLGALPTLARHCTAVLAADLGLSRKCLVMDLDNTLWGGVIGEDGLGGIKLGQGSPEGEAYLSLQEYILALRTKGVILAVCSKNNDADAREPFLKHPEMRLRMDDIAAFVANWDTKPENLRRIAKMLNIGLDSLAFLDDNPVERDIVRQMLPEVDVIALPRDPFGFRRALSMYPMFETSTFTEEDARRTEQYRARAQIAELEAGATSIEEFYRGLQMKAEIEPFTDVDLPRIVQLIGKTNQFNLTTRRHGMAQIRSFIDDPGCVHFSVKLRDRFTDHGLVALMIARRHGEVLDIDTWLMSCRVIGRTVEAEMLQRLCREAQRLGCSCLRGSFIPTEKNGMVKDIFAQFGFTRDTLSGGEQGQATSWTYDLNTLGMIRNEFIEIVECAGEAAVDAA